MTRARAAIVLALVGACSGAAGREDVRALAAIDASPAAAAAVIARDCHAVRPDRRARLRCGSALLATGEAREDQGDVEGAIARYTAIADAAARARTRGGGSNDDDGDDRDRDDRDRVRDDAGGDVALTVAGAAAWDAAARAAAGDLAGLDRRAITDDIAAEARFRAGRLAFAAGEPERAGLSLWRLVVELPDEPRAGDAVEFVVARTRADQPAALWQRLSALVEAFPDRQVTDNLLWWLADLAEHELHDPAAALVLYDRLPVDHPQSGFRDDARWRGALLARARGDSAGAARRLRGLLATREVARGLGSYFSIHLDDAQLLLATILRDDLHDRAGAIGAFARLPADYPRSILVDDALAAWAELALAGGDVPAACRVAARLLAHDPASRFAPRATAIRAAHCSPSGHKAMAGGS